MYRTNTRLQSQHAPCGRVVDADTYLDEEDEELIVTDVSYACGCRTIRQEYHDGSVSRTVLGHDGKPVVNELLDKE